MRRRRQVEEHENHERWLVSYADFITLLFAFFVVMYSVSSVNEGKYRVLSDSLEAAFRQVARSLEPVQEGEPARSSKPTTLTVEGEPFAIDLPFPTRPREDKGENGAANGVEGPGKAGPHSGFVDPDMAGLAARLETALGELLDDDLIAIHQDERWVEVEIKSSILFRSGKALLAASAYPVLDRVSAVLGPLGNPVHVEGFTDDNPIFTDNFRSNWELSADRAVSVVHLFKDNGIAPERLSAIGYGAERPVADNRTPEGRARNRRVAIVILPGQDPRWARTAEGLSGALSIQEAQEEPANLNRGRQDEQNRKTGETR